MKRDSFGSSLGILLALAGSAVGLGNLWRFPYLVGTSGGAAFIIIYLVIVFILALPIMYSEFILGRRAQSNVFGGFRKLAPNSNWGIVGIISLVCSAMILSFYSVVGGWSIDYLIKAICFEFTSNSASLDGMFEQTVTSSFQPLFYVVVFVMVSGLILLAGVKDGIEKYSKILMPLLFVMVVIIAIRSVTLPNAGGGIDFLFKPDFSKVTASTFLDALGQAFFSLSIGSGMVFTYGSYVKRKENIVGLSIKTSIVDTTFALIASVAIMPAVFAFGISPGQGPGLVFVTLPYVFAQIPFGSVLAILFFFVVFIAAITSSISLLEVMVAYLFEELNFKRKSAVLTSVGIIIFFGIFCSLSQGLLSDFKIFGYNIFDLFDKTSANILMPLGAFLFVFYAGWKLKKEDFVDELTSGGMHKFNAFALNFIYWSVKYLAPIVVAVILVSGLI